MFERFSRIAERAATKASRRQFLGRLGRGAVTLAASLGGILAFPLLADAARGGKVCSPDLEGPCQGMKAGSSCDGPNGPGKCQAVERLADGYYSCICKAPKRGGDNKDKA